MNIEIVGVHPSNKGALLMLEAVRERMVAAFPRARFAVPINWPTDQRIEARLWAAFPREWGPFDCTFLMNLVPKRVRAHLGLWAPGDVDVVLDASGFGYGDHWGTRKAKRRLPAKKGNQLIVLLPQALGPFEQPGMADAFRDVLNVADLAFVRDPFSMRYVEALGPVSASVDASPDFTCLLHPTPPAHLRYLQGAGLIIPNQKVAHSDAAKEGLYLEFLTLAAAAIQKTGRRTVVLVHEGVGDMRIAEKLNQRLVTPLEIVNEPSPLVTKAIIGQAALTVSSRFHGLVSALSGSVPSLACGWSHKYGALMNDYGCDDFQVDLGNKAQWPSLIDRLIKACGDEAFKDRLKAAAQLQVEASEAMWAKVIALIKART